MPDNQQSTLRVAVVGACASGKSTLVASLRDAGYEARHVAQDHSFVPDMWLRISRPDILIYLGVNYETVKARRPKTTFRQVDLTEQERRLEHARNMCDLHIDTNRLSSEEVFNQALIYLHGL